MLNFILGCLVGLFFGIQITKFIWFEINNKRAIDFAKQSEALDDVIETFSPEIRERLFKLKRYCDMDCMYNKDETYLNINSVKTFKIFVDRCVWLNKPSIGLTPDNDIYIEWSNRGKTHLGIQFLNDEIAWCGGRTDIPGGLESGKCKNGDIREVTSKVIELQF